jgi:hypothetical protein
MREPHNRTRGEVLLTIDGRERRLCVTLGALAELEAAFNVNSLSELGEQLARLSASELITVLAALTAGGGQASSAAELAAAHIEPGEAARAVAEAFKIAFADER